MASRRRNTTAYGTYGSVAYAPVYDGSAVRAPGREEAQGRPRPKQRQQTRSRALSRTKAQVREAGQVAPFAVIGFLAVAAFAAMLLLSYVQYTVVSGDVVRLRRELNTLQEQNATLSAQYEQVFDNATIQALVGEDAAQPTSDQVVYIDLSEEDTVTVFSGESAGGALSRAAEAIGGAFEDLIEYFR